jgi:UDP-N-acetylmuramoylalanine--D-glutamate ligase
MATDTIPMPSSSKVLLPTSWQQQPVSVLGLSKSGAAVARYIAKRGGNVFLSEVLPSTPATATLQSELAQLGVIVETGGHTQRCYSHAPWVVTSPGIPPTSPVMQQLKMSGIPVISEVELAFLESQQRPALSGQSTLKPIPWIGITGTNGKTTTTTLVSRMLLDFGKHAPVCGNIGVPVMDLLDQAFPVNPNDTPGEPLDYLVAELSSFQLTFSPTLRPTIAAFLNLTPDHITWHGSLESYKTAKTSFLVGERSPDWVVLNADDPQVANVAIQTQGQVAWFTRQPSTVESLFRQPHTTLVATAEDDGTLVLHTLDSSGHRVILPLITKHTLRLPGEHNVENVLAASAMAWLAGVSPQSIATTLAAFEGVTHRIEWCGRWQRLDNITVNAYNDSKATNVSAALAALNAFPGQPVVLIAGGRPKEEPLEPFVDACSRQVSAVVVYGEAQQRFAQALEKGGYGGAIITINTLAEALEAGKALVEALPLNRSEEPASPILLFSPACASFDQFANFEVRGDVFKATLQGLLNS